MSSNMLATLEFQGTSVRMVGTQDHPEWVAADVCAALGIQNPSDALSNFPEKSTGIATTDTSAGPREVLTVKESGLYRLVARSRKPEALRFQDFIYEEVLPCIRKHGCWPAPDVTVAGNALVTVNREFMVEMGQVLREAVFGAVTPIREEVGELRDTVGGLLTSVEDIKNTIDDMHKRKPLTTETKRLHVMVVYKHFGGKCPCCHEMLIVGEDKQPLLRLNFDHWVRRTMNGPKETWAVCNLCNSKFNDHDFKAECKLFFDAYQKRREMFQRSIAGPSLPFEME